MNLIHFKKFNNEGLITFIADKIIAFESSDKNKTSIFVLSAGGDGDEFIVGETYQQVVEIIEKHKKEKLMNKIYFCENCGTQLKVSLKATNYGVLRIVEYHECPDEPVETNLKSIDVPAYTGDDDKKKFVQKLNDLRPSKIAPDLDLKDRRDQQDIKTTAPQTLLDQIKIANPTDVELKGGWEPDEET